MAVLTKINESKFFLQKILEHYQQFPDVQYYFNAFLNSTYSISAHLLEDYNKKYDLGITLEENLSVKHFEEMAKASGKTDALRFISWYKANIKKIKSTTLGKIITKKRHQSTHREPVEVESFAKLMWGDNVSQNIIEQIHLANPMLPKTVIYTDEMAYVEIKDCEPFLNELINMVYEAQKQFPNESMDLRTFF